MAQFMSKSEVLSKLEKFGIKSGYALNRLIREQNFPVNYLTPRKQFFDETAVDLWLNRRSKAVMGMYDTQVKIQKYQRKKRNEKKNGGLSVVNFKGKPPTEAVAKQA